MGRHRLFSASRGSQSRCLVCQRATKAVSVLGAAVGGGGPTKLIDYINNNTDDDHPVPPPLNSKKGQAFLIDYTAERSNATRTIYMTLAPKFIDEFLLNQLIAAASVKFESALDDNQFVNFVGSVDGHEIRRTSVWEDFVFPNYNCTRDKGRNGLYHFILEQLTKAIKQFDLQYKQYSARLDKYEKEQSRYKWAKHTRSGRKESKPTPPGQFVPDIDFGLPLDQNSLFKITTRRAGVRWRRARRRRRGCASCASTSARAARLAALPGFVLSLARERGLRYCSRAMTAARSFATCGL